MKASRRVLPWLAAGVLVALAAGGWYGYREWTAQGNLAALLPPGASTVAQIDVQVLRQAGILEALAGPRTAEEPDYVQFVRQTSFDYRRDLHGLALAYDGESVYMAARGSFDWDKLKRYATTQGGSCNGDFCRVPSSRPNRTISFYPAGRQLLALAVSPDFYAANRVTPRPQPSAFRAPSDQPIWLSIEPGQLKGAALPTGTKLFASALSQAQTLMLTLGPSGQRFELAMQVQSRTALDAEVLETQLKGITDLVRKMLARDRQKPSAADLTGVLLGGTFRRDDRQVFAAWPVERAFFDALTKGKS